MINAFLRRLATLYLYASYWLVPMLLLPLLLAGTLLTAPFQVPDEHAHFLRSAQIADLNLAILEQEGSRGGMVRTGLVRLARDPRFTPEAFHNDKHIDHSAYFSQDYWHLRAGNTLEFTGYANTALNPALNYAFPSLGLAIGLQLDGGALAGYYSGRIVGALLAALLVFLALQRIRRGRAYCFLLLAMPMSMALIGSYSQDSALILYTLAAVAFGNQYLDQLPSRRTTMFLVAMSLLFLFVILGRPPYMPMLAIPLLIAQGRRDRFIAAGLFLISLLVVGFWIQAIHAGYPNPIPGADPFEQRQFVIAHPFQFLWTMVTALMNQSWILAKQFVGVLGWLDVHLPGYVRIGYLAFIIHLLWLYRNNREERSSMLGASLVGIFLMVLFLIMLAEYLYWTPVGKADIDGLQGRYFIPPALSLSLMFGTRLDPGKQTFSFLMSGIAPVFVAIANVTALVVVVLKYWS